MTTIEAIRARRSVRQYKPGAEIPQEQIDLLLEAAMMAPSACNTRPWEFLVVRSREKLDQLAEQHPHAKMLKTASLAIVVCGLPQVQSGISDGFYPQDCAAATQNILLQATELGLGTCWCGVYPKEPHGSNVKQVLGYDGVPVSLIAVGVPDDAPKARGFLDPEKVRYF